MSMHLYSSENNSVMGGGNWVSIVEGSMLSVNFSSGSLHVGTGVEGGTLGGT